jgi:hypothetical protein
MKRLSIVLLIVFFIVPGLLFSTTVEKKRLVNHPAYPVIDNNSINHQQTTDYPYSGVTDDEFLVGTTYYDFTNYGTISRIIANDDQGNIHFNWTNGLNLNAVDRHVYYNFYTTSSGVWLVEEEGVPVLSSQRSGFSCMDILSDGKAVVNSHSQMVAGAGFFNNLAVDFFYGFGAFSSAASVEDSIYWPHVSVDVTDVGHMLARLHGDANPQGGDYTLMYYTYSNDLLNNFTPEVEPFIFADTCNVPSFDIVCSDISDRAAIGYHQFLGNYLDYGLWAGLLAGQVNNDAYIIRKESGQDWDWENPINISKVIVGDNSYLPDTLNARGDTLRAYLDIQLMYDNDDVLHAVFTTRGLWETPWDPTSALDGLSEASFLWHWREDTDSLNVVAYGWWNAYDSLSSGVGAWKSTICRPNLGIDDDGNIYCVYELYPDADNPLTKDIAANLYTNGEVYVTVSTDGGFNWAEPTNITRSNSDGAVAGQCMSECFPGIAKHVDDYVHLFYMEDKDAGSYVFETETQSTENPMIYNKYPVSEISTEPLIDQFYFHIRPVPREPLPVAKPVAEFSPEDFTFVGNYPNPFNPNTSFEFTLDRSIDVDMYVYDIQGRLVAELVNDFLEAGKHSIKWNAENMSSGVYFCELTAGGHTQTVKALLIK